MCFINYWYYDLYGTAVDFVPLNCGKLLGRFLSSNLFQPRQEICSIIFFLDLNWCLNFHPLLQPIRNGRLLDTILLLNVPFIWNIQDSSEGGNHSLFKIIILDFHFIIRTQYFCACRRWGLLVIQLDRLIVLLLNGRRSHHLSQGFICVARQCF